QWTNPPPKALAHAPRRRHGPAPVCVGESRRLRRDEKVARKHQLKGAGVAVALHRRDYWLGQRFDRVQRLGLEVLRGRPLTSLDGLDVVACGKRLAGPTKYHTADCVRLCGDGVDVLAQFDEQVRA